MIWIERFNKNLSSRRAQHLVYLLHLWLCVPFLYFWVTDRHIEEILGLQAFDRLRMMVLVLVGYMIVRTWLAYLDPPRLKWWLVFPPIDIALITVVLCITHRGPMSNIAFLYFLPMAQASGSLNVRWSAAVGLMVIVGTAITVLFVDQTVVQAVPANWQEMLRSDPLNVAFRLFILFIISSLMGYQALIAAGYRERLGVAADRNRIAMDMHDGLQGHLISIASQLELISRLAERDGKQAAVIAHEGRESARQAADELRFLVQRMRAPSMASGFVAALRQYSHNICERNGLRLVFKVDGPESTLTSEVENVLFRIAQEGLTNIVKHANAKEVSISLEITETQARLQLRDDGNGFDISKIDSGIGLEGMRSRAKDVRGELTIDSKPQSGTCVEARFGVRFKHA